MQPTNLSKTKGRQPMRSSIACWRCRRSKIKCDNDGGQRPCDGCVKTSNICEYPDAGGNPQRRSEPTASKPERDVFALQPQADRGRRCRRVDEVVRVEEDRAPHYAQDVLSQPFLSEDVWASLLGLYKMHFATELPFLHIPSLRDRISKISEARARNSDEKVIDDKSSASNLVLLGVLMLTARFHGSVVRYIASTVNSTSGAARSRAAPAKSDPMQASEYYAEILLKSLGGARTLMTDLSVERVQVYLMLAVHEWVKSSPETSSGAAWMWVGTAVRMAQGLWLASPSPSNGQRPSTALNANGPTRHESLDVDAIIEEEIRRRTMFACFIMDTLMSSSSFMASRMLQPKDLRIQLPCSEASFDFSRPFYTGYLDESVAPDSQRPVDDDNVLARFIRVVDIWGEVSRYSRCGGRKSTSAPPWEPNSTFTILTSRLNNFCESLPPLLVKSTQNCYTYDNHGLSTFVTLHMLVAACRIMLYREYLPFIAFRCDRPAGPFDAKFAPGQYAPAGFWEDCASRVFSAAKDITDLLQYCQNRDKDTLPRSNLVVFCTWSAAFIGVYANNFPHMDTAHRMYDGAINGAAGAPLSGPMKVAEMVLRKLAVTNPLAAIYSRHFDIVSEFYRDARNALTESAAAASAARGMSRLRSENGFVGGPSELARLGGHNENDTAEEPKQDRHIPAHQATWNSLFHPPPPVPAEHDSPGSPTQHRPQMFHGLPPPLPVAAAAVAAARSNSPSSRNLRSGGPAASPSNHDYAPGGTHSDTAGIVLPPLKSINDPQQHEMLKSVAQQAANLHQATSNRPLEHHYQLPNIPEEQQHPPDELYDGIPEGDGCRQHFSVPWSNKQYLDLEGLRMGEVITGMEWDLFPSWFTGYIETPVTSAAKPVTTSAVTTTNATASTTTVGAPLHFNNLVGPVVEHNGGVGSRAREGQQYCFAAIATPSGYIGFNAGEKTPEVLPSRLPHFGQHSYEQPEKKLRLSEDRG